MERTISRNTRNSQRLVVIPTVSSVSMTRRLFSTIRVRNATSISQPANTILDENRQCFMSIVDMTRRKILQNEVIRRCNKSAHLILSVSI